MPVKTLLREIIDIMRRPFSASNLALATFILVLPASIVGSCSGRDGSAGRPNPVQSKPTPTTTPASSTIPVTVDPHVVPLNDSVTPGALAVSVKGSDLVDKDGAVIQLRGVNRPGMEFRCVENIPYGFITDSGDQAGQQIGYAAKVVSAIQDWGKGAVNTVRVPLNEDCWLGINGATSAYSGQAYQDFVKDLTARLTAAGIYTVLDLHWSAPGKTLATKQDVAPNRDHSIEFWRQVAQTFGGAPSVMFDLLGEPRIWCNTCEDYSKAADTAWSLYRDGGTYTYDDKQDYTGRTGSFEVAGTQELVDVIRGEGAQNVILLGGLGWANSLDNWVKFLPNDPANQIAASMHMYANSGANVNNTKYLENTLAIGGLSKDYPIVIGEFGEVICNAPSTGFAQRTMDWADAKGYSYLAWGWDQGEGCAGPSLVTDNTGVPSDYGKIVRDHLRSKAS